MPQQAPHSDSLRAVERRLVAASVASNDIEAVFSALCEDLLAAGFPLWCVAFAAPTIDPSHRRVGIAWRRGQGLRINTTAHGEDGAAKYVRSPIGWLNQRGLASGGWRLDGSEPIPDLPILLELAEEGGTEYIQRRTTFDQGTAIQRHAGADAHLGAVAWEGVDCRGRNPTWASALPPEPPLRTGWLSMTPALPTWPEAPRRYGRGRSPGDPSGLPGSRP